MKKILILSVLFITLALGLSAEDYKKSIQIGVGYAYTYHDTFGGLQSAYVPSVVYNFHITNDFLLGIVLGRFQHNAFVDNQLMQYQYGFTFTHLIPKAWVDMGVFQPFFGYGILLSQTWKPDGGAREISHTTLIDLGGEFAIGDQHRLGFVLNWTSSDLPSFFASNDKISNIGAELFYRLLF